MNVALRVVIGDISQARRYLELGRVADAIVWFGEACRSLGIEVGRVGPAGEGPEIAQARGALIHLAAEIGVAAEPERVAPETLRAELVVALSVLRQSGAQVTDAQIEERAANVAAGICGAYDVRVPRRRA